MGQTGLMANGTQHGPHHGGAHGGITVIGSGTARAAVDRAEIAVTVEVTEEDAGDAFRAASASAAAVLATLTSRGVHPREVRTVDVTLGPHYDYQNGEQRLLGYQAAQRLTVSTGALEVLGDLLGALAATGRSVRIDSVSLAASNPREAGSDARTAAMIDAREKAMSLAALAGRPLGAVIAVEEQADPPPRPFALSAHTARDAAMPIATGDTDLAASVRVHFAWADQ